MKRLLMLPVLLVAGLTVVGCNSVKAPIEGRQDPYTPSQVMFTSKDLKNHTAIDAPRVARDDSGGILHVTLPIRAATNMQLYIDYRVSFFDRNGQLINQTAWFNKTLAPNVPDQLTANSMSPRAADFQFDLRYAK